MKKIWLTSEGRPYINKYKGKVFVIKIGGGLIEDPGNIDNICEDICLLQSKGIHMVVIHGGGPQADAIAKKLGYPIKKVEGKRVTSKEMLEIAKMVYAGKINIELLSSIRKHNENGVGLSGVDGNLVIAKKEKIRKIKGKNIDFGLVGKIIKVNPGIIMHLAKNNYLPVIASIVADEQGEIYNVNADAIAEEIAKSLKAEKFINMTNTNGILATPGDNNSCIPYLSLKEAKKLLKEKKIVTKGMLPKLGACVSTIKGGVKSANIIDGTLKHSLLFEIFTDKGSGTYVGK